MPHTPNTKGQASGGDPARSNLRAIATRRSPLALWQANQAALHLQELGFATEIVTTDTTGDRIQHTRLSNAALLGLPETSEHLASGKGLFIKEVQDLLLAGRCHLAVHSLKDLPVTQTPELVIGGFLPSASARDVLVLHAELAQQNALRKWLNGPTSGGSHGARDQALGNTALINCLESLLLAKGNETWRGKPIGTTSLRRTAAMRRLGLRQSPVTVLRGNVDTRLNKLRQGDFAAIVLAEAGLRRLGCFDSSHMIPLDETEFVPACAQGVVALEAHATDKALLQSLFRASNPVTLVRIALERLVLRLLGGDCHSIVGIHLRLLDEEAAPLTVAGIQDGFPGGLAISGDLHVFTATPDNGSVHQSSLDVVIREENRAAHNDAKGDANWLGWWIGKALNELKRFSSFSELFDCYCNDAQLAAVLTKHLSENGHLGDVTASQGNTPSDKRST